MITNDNNSCNNTNNTNDTNNHNRLSVVCPQSLVHRTNAGDIQRHGTTNIQNEIKHINQATKTKNECWCNQEKKCLARPDLKHARRDPHYSN